VTGTLSQLHNNVENSCAVARTLAWDSINVSHKDIAVEFLLHGTHACKENGLVLWQEGLFDVGFQTTHHKGAQDLV